MAHLRMTGRVFENGRLIGYEVTDGNEVRKLSKEEAWVYARHNLIENVKASGPVSKTLVTGINGFEIRKLPEVVYGDISKNKEKIISTTEKANSDNPKSLKEISYNILIENTLQDKNSIGRVIGYRIRNIGQKPINYTHMTATTEHTTSESILQPNESVYINRAELVLLGRRYSNYFANGYIKSTGIVDTGEISGNTYKELCTFWQFVIYNRAFLYKDEEIEKIFLKKNIADILVDIQDFLSPDIISKYFIPNKEEREVKQTKTENIFKMFNRR